MGLGYVELFLEFWALRHAGGHHMLGNLGDPGQWHS